MIASNIEHVKQQMNQSQSERGRKEEGERGEKKNEEKGEEPRERTKRPSLKPLTRIKEVNAQRQLDSSLHELWGMHDSQPKS